MVRSGHGLQRRGLGITLATQVRQRGLATLNTQPPRSFPHVTPPSWLYPRPRIPQERCRHQESIFAILRVAADVILVGRRTIETEGYGPLELDDVHQKQRTAAGKKPLPSIAVVSNELDLDWSAPIFAEAEVTPLVITSQSCSREN